MGTQNYANAMLKWKLIFIFFPISFAIFSMAHGQINEPALKPNIIFILTDDQRWDALGYSGNDIIQTPEMDKLASQGVYFKNAIVTTPICSASRSSIFSGVYERSHKYSFGSDQIHERYMTHSYPNLLKDAGYYTGFFGKFGVKYPKMNELFDEVENIVRGDEPDRRGYYYKKLNGETVHLTRYAGQKALDFIENAPRDKPFSLSLSFSAPHAQDNAPLQYFWQEEPDKLYQDIDIPDPEIADDEYFNKLPMAVRAGFNRLRWTWRYDTPEKYQHSVKGYYRMINGIDLEIAKIRKKLEETGQDKNTVIIFTGDNGYFLGERQLAGKWLMYDNSLRVPLIIYDPRAGEHRDVDDMALNIDITATILDLAGIKVPDVYQGKSLLPIVTGEENSLDREAVLIEHLWEFDDIPPSEGVRTEEWKYIRYVNNKSIEELYNLVDDPKEVNNLATNPKYKDILDEYRNKNDKLADKYEDLYSGTPDDLSVNMQERKAKFNWSVPEVTGEQQAYQILISSTREAADHNIGDVWDSKRVEEAGSTNVEVVGASLDPDRSYYWKVRIYDKINRISEYSKAITFNTKIN